MANVRVKICGLTDEAAVSAVADSGAEYAGFVYFPASPRHLELPRAAKLAAMLPAAVQSVSVVVDAEDALLREIHATVKPRCVQLHGKETPERVRAIRALLPGCILIKALAIKTADDIANAMRYADSVDMLLFDARAPELPGVLPGGNGLSFDWTLLRNREFGKPWFLSGGLNADNLKQSIALSGAMMVDVSSSVESAPGVKDAALIATFVKAAKQA